MRVKKNLVILITKRLVLPVHYSATVDNVANNELLEQWCFNLLPDVYYWLDPTRVHPKCAKYNCAINLTQIWHV